MNKRKRRNRGYAMKLTRGRQMYGPGCCAHTVTGAQIEKAREEARKHGHFRSSGLIDGLRE